MRLIAYLNGELVDADTAAVSIDDRGLLYGDGVFETCRWYRTGFFRFAEHMSRLRAGARSLRLDVPDDATLRDIAQRLAAELGAPDATLRVTITRGTPQRSPTVLVTMSPVPAGWQEKARAGWSLVTAATRHPPLDALPSHIKSLGRVHGILARFEAEDAGADDALLLRSDGVVVEGPTWNVFWRTGDTLCTPAVETGILEGVTRVLVMDLARAQGMRVREASAHRTSLDGADEMFATMTSSGLVRIRSLDGSVFKGSSAFDVLFPAYWASVAAEIAGTGTKPA